MGVQRAVRRLAPVLVLLTIAVPAPGQTAQDAKPTPFKPQVGQYGKDVVWVPTPQALVERMLDMAKVTPQDVVMDLGSGDGRTVITAAERGARALGIEYNPDMVDLSKLNAAKVGVGDRAEFVKADLFEADLTRATVITLFLLPDINLKLRPKLLDLQPGTRVVSNTFTMDDWMADDTATVGDECTTWCTAMLWIVPAKVAGTWKWRDAELTLSQRFQMVTGTLRLGGRQMPVEGRLRGDRLGFLAGGTAYEGTVAGATIDGTATTGPSSFKWTATRVQ